MNYLVLFSIHPIFLFEFIFLGGLILKMKKFVIQWRKFEFKRSYIYEDMNFLDFLEFISIFLGIYFNFFRLKRQKCGVGPAQM